MEPREDPVRVMMVDPEAVKATRESVTGRIEEMAGREAGAWGHECGVPDQTPVADGSVGEEREQEEVVEGRRPAPSWHCVWHMIPAKQV